jgi:hypothetical protein
MIHLAPSYRFLFLELNLHVGTRTERFPIGRIISARLEVLGIWSSLNQRRTLDPYNLDWEYLNPTSL